MRLQPVRDTPTAAGWRIGRVADFRSKLEIGVHVSTTQNHRDAIERVEQAIAESERLTGRRLAELLVDRRNGRDALIVLVTDKDRASG